MTSRPVLTAGFALGRESGDQNGIVNVTRPRVTRRHVARRQLAWARGGPLGGLGGATRDRVLGRSLLGVVVLGAVMGVVGRPMGARGHTIVALELAGTTERVDAVLAAWGDDGRRAATTQTWMDMGWLTLYATSLAAGTAAAADLARRHEWRRAALVADLAGWAAVVGAACDAVENAAMLAELRGRRGGLPALSRRAARLKFALVVPAAGVGLLGAAATVVTRRRGRD